ncbi:MAG: hypothetical protein QOE51_3840 [Actinoplanes sp.]|nr:hypothetical protein [Actinoplanes sp.]
MSRQPLLHDLVATLSAPTSVLSGLDGQIRATGVQGGFHADTRVLSQAILRLDGREPTAIGHTVESASRTRFVALARWLGDPTVRVERVREVGPGLIEERIEIVSTAEAPVRTTVTVDVGLAQAAIGSVRSGRRGPTPEGVLVTVTGDLSWQVEVAPRQRVVLTWRLAVRDERAVVSAPIGGPQWATPRLGPGPLARLVGRSLADLSALRLSDGRDTYLGAGLPWYLTLFGRDSLWAARMMLPLGTTLAAGTLRVLARRQGTKVDPEAAEAPGKIMHELRRQDVGLRFEGRRLPPVYYGTIDATLLWISLLHDAWRWGLAEDEVGDLLPAMEGALGWLRDFADPDGDGFLEYRDTSGHGLANQGWKDSGDAVRFRDGRQAEPPIALVEVQGYAYRAALDGAALLDAFGRPGGDRWREYAGGLADRFRARFWVDGGYPALALDRDKRPVDALTSNIGHLLDTGILNAAEEQAVAAALAGDVMSGGYGLRTMAADSGGYSPLSYHCGSVWTHDTAIVIAGLAKTAFSDAANALIDGLLVAAETFDYRLPELHSGDARRDFDRPMPYPAACRPQAWAAAAAIAILSAQLGIYPDVPNGLVALRPIARPLAVQGLRIAGHDIDISVAADGTASLSGLPPGLSVQQGVDADGQAGPARH